MKKRLLTIQVVLLFLFVFALTKYMWIEEVLALFFLPIPVVFITLGLIALIGRIFKKNILKKYISICFIVASILQILLCLFIIWSAYPRNFNKDQVCKDLDSSVALMEDIHPNLYTKIDEDSFTVIIDSVKTAMPEKMTDTEVNKMFAAILSYIKDGHTGLAMDNYIKRGCVFFRKALPYRLKIKNDRMFLLENFYIRNSIPVGSEILSINNKPVSRCLKEISRLMSYETISFRNAWLQLPIIWGLWNNQQDFTITYQTPDGITETVTTSSGLFANWSYLWDFTGGFGSKNYAYKILEGDIAFIKLMAFRDLNKFKKFLQTTFADIKRNGIENLIIDIRRSTGGASSVSEEFMQYISPVAYTTFDTSLLKISDHLITKYSLDTTKYIPGSLYLEKRGFKALRENPLRFSGSCYILVSGLCFSTSLDFPAMARYFNAGKLIGSETGGRTISFGSPATVSLPETGTVISVSRKKFVNVGGKQSDRGLIPDYIVENSIEDDMEGIDRVLDYAISIIRSDQ